MKRVMIGTPSYTGDVCCDYAQSLTIAAAHCASKGYFLEPCYAPNFSLVELARNYIVSEFLKSQATHLFWIDADLGFDPGAVYKLIARDLDVVAGVYVTKSDTHSTYPYTAIGPVIDGLQEADRVPGGFLCMKRAAVEKAVETCEWIEMEVDAQKRTAPRFFDVRVVDGNKYFGEDFVACQRLRRAGFKIYVETNIGFKHFGRRAYSGNLARALEKDAAGDTANTAHDPAVWKRNADFAAANTEGK